MLPGQQAAPRSNCLFLDQQISKLKRAADAARFLLMQLDYCVSSAAVSAAISALKATPMPLQPKPMATRAEV